MESPVPVAHVTPHYPPYLGGLEKVVEALATARVARGLPVEVFTARDRPPPGAGRPAPDPPYVHRLAAVEVAHTALIPELPVRLLRLRPGTVVHLHVAQAFTPEAVWLAHRLRGVPYIAHLHIDAGPTGPAGGLLRVYKPHLLRRVLLQAAIVVVFTLEQAEAVVAAHGVDPALVRVVPNGVDDSYFHPPRRLPTDRLPRLLFVGRLSAQKNLPQLLDALEGVSQRFDTVLVGNGELERSLKAHAERLGLVNVTFPGRADGDDLLGHYGSADVFVLPSEREGMPLALLEAQAMALPIVATDIPGTRDLVVDGELGTLVPVDDPAAMRGALERLVSDPDVYERMSAAARANAEAYSWERVSERFEDLYTEAASTAS
jgi:glycosyltransferase involved in cell wall biosynthesis